MPKFVLIDHSLESIGGHFYEYAIHLLTAAQAAGYRVVLGTNRRFRKQTGVPGSWTVFPIFRHTTFCEFAAYVSGEVWDSQGPTQRSWRLRRGESGLRSPMARLRERIGYVQAGWHDSQGERLLENFAHDCRSLFQSVPLERGDHVFLPTMSEFDLTGLVRFLASAPQTQQVEWHLQFHFDVFQGRNPDYCRQTDQLAAMKRHFANVLRQVPEHRLHFYCTTDLMSDQYNRLGVTEFETLPYPVNAAFRPRDPEPRTDNPLRISCAGHLRREKGRFFLSELIESLWTDYFASGRIQLQIQGSRLRYRRLKARVGALSRVAHPQSGRAEQPPLVLVRHPLSKQDYVEFIRHSDIGLFLYDSDRYYARCSGILVEMLSAGVPVIVPGGCWLSEQIAEPIYRHQDALCRDLPVVAQIPPEEISWRMPKSTRSSSGLAENLLTFADRHAAASCELPIPSTATDLVVRFRWVQPTEPGTYVRMHIEQYDRADVRCAQFMTLAGHRSTGASVPSLVHLERRTAYVRIRLENAFHDAAISLKDVQATVLSAAVHERGSCPAGAVGLIAADREQVPALLRDMIEHHAHYRATAQEHSREWRREHHPRVAAGVLVANGRAAAGIEDGRRRLKRPSEVCLPGGGQ
jgi:glycosyltransferase involved in cell wall biosynthesis